MTATKTARRLEVDDAINLLLRNSGVDPLTAGRDIIIGALRNAEVEDRCDGLLALAEMRRELADRRGVLEVLEDCYVVPFRAVLAALAPGIDHVQRADVWDVLWEAVAGLAALDRDEETAVRDWLWDQDTCGDWPVHVEPLRNMHETNRDWALDQLTGQVQS